MFKKLKVLAIGPATWLNKVSRGKLKPNTVTLLGLLLHLPVGWLIVTGNLFYGGLVLILVAPLDVLDGALARLQNRTSDFGGWLDACSDRLKETIVFGGLAYYLAENQDPLLVGLCAGALGVSILISYVKAKGEALLARRLKKIKSAQLNDLLSGGLLSYEGRVLIVALILISQQFAIGLSIIIALGLITILQRGLKFKEYLESETNDN